MFVHYLREVREIIEHIRWWVNVRCKLWENSSSQSTLLPCQILLLSEGFGLSKRITRQFQRNKLVPCWKQQMPKIPQLLLCAYADFPKGTSRAALLFNVFSGRKTQLFSCQLHIVMHAWSLILQSSHSLPFQPSISLEFFQKTHSPSRPKDVQRCRNSSSPWHVIYSYHFVHNLLFIFILVAGLSPSLLLPSSIPPSGFKMRDTLKKKKKKKE